MSPDDFYPREYQPFEYEGGEEERLQGEIVAWGTLRQKAVSDKNAAARAISFYDGRIAQAIDRLVELRLSEALPEEASPR